MLKTIRPAKLVEGAIQLPGDKSISHRYAILASLAEGTSHIHNYSTGADCHSTLNAVRALGIQIEEQGTDVTIHGQGLNGWNPPAGELDAGNSGSSIRMLSGALAAQRFISRIGGDESLSRRPMDRVMDPLKQMGGRISARDGRFPPLTIEGAPLHAIDYTLPVPSAQVKTCVLFAGMYAEGATIVREPIRSRDHTEIALREFGADITTKQRVITLQGPSKLEGRELMIPSDLSSAAFFIVAALLIPGSRLVIGGVG
ncbi:MAG: 3-phosphoshikimate 1-carboxyvinyltransferase, partial [Acidobacteriota bacterium]|nr:3-phosphoshikimate 1-carboxyvinyltransferase [Acidobacteriota bacterium]